MTTILFARESDCDENPGGHDLRATLLPADVPAYVAAGFDVVVERGLGSGVGYLDTHYELAGARVEPHPTCYGGKDLVVKLKGPAPAEIAQLTPGTVLFSMGHLYCFPERERLLAEKGVRLIGMESLTTAEDLPAGYADGVRAGVQLDSGVLGSHPVLRVGEGVAQGFVNGLIRTAMRTAGSPLRVVPHGAAAEPASAEVLAHGCGAVLRTASGELRDLTELPERLRTAYEQALGAEQARPGRAIGQIREVGIGGTSYGLGLYRRQHDGQDPHVVVLGYGGCSMGAFEHLCRERVPFTVLGRQQTSRSALPAWLRESGLIVNGAEGPEPGTEFIITSEQASTCIKPGSVVIDLIGGSPAQRSPVETFEWTTFLPDIHVESGGVSYAGLWGWDMYYSMHDTAVEYSRRIRGVLAASDRYARSVDDFVADHAFAQQLGV